MSDRTKDPAVLRAERIAGDFLSERAKSSYPIIGKGSVNQVCVVETENRKVVVRMNGRDAYPDYLKEKWCIEQAAAAGIPGPEVLSVGIAEDAAYMIQSFVEGSNGLDSTVPKSVIWRRLGEYAKRIHAIPVKGFGENLLDPVQGVFQSPPHPGSDGSWPGYVQYNIDSLTEHDRLIALGVVTRTESRRVRERFERVKAASFGFGVNHGDLSLKNTIIDETGRVVLLDWGSAEVNPHSDVLQVMQCHIQGGDPDRAGFEAFCDGYGLSAAELADMQPLLLLRAFDKLRWAIDRSPDLVDAYAAYAKQIADIS